MIQSLPPINKRLSKFARQHNLIYHVVEIDYLLSWILAAIATDDILGTQLVFKGGTALRKCYFGDYRVSEDLDFTALPGTPAGDDLAHRIGVIIAKAEEAINEHEPIRLTWERYKEKELHPHNQEAFKVRAQFPGQREPLVVTMIEISFAEQLAYPSVQRPILHPYGEAFDQQVAVHPLEEILVEKLRGVLQRTKKLHERSWTRSRTRDYYDLYRLLKRDSSLFQDERASIYLTLKCFAKGVLFESVEDFFLIPSIWSKSIGTGNVIWDIFLVISLL